EVPAALLVEVVAVGEERRDAVEEIGLLARAGRRGVAEDEAAEVVPQAAPGDEPHAELEGEDGVVQPAHPPANRFIEPRRSSAAPIRSPDAVTRTATLPTFAGGGAFDAPATNSWSLTLEVATFW